MRKDRARCDWNREQGLLERPLAGTVPAAPDRRGTAPAGWSHRWDRGHREAVCVLTGKQNQIAAAPAICEHREARLRAAQRRRILCWVIWARLMAMDWPSLVARRTKAASAAEERHSDEELPRPRAAVATLLPERSVCEAAFRLSFLLAGGEADDADCEDGDGKTPSKPL